MVYEDSARSRLVKDCTMTYQSTWWYPNYVEYGTGLNSPKTWPNVMEQYRRPDALTELRHYDIPVDEYQGKLHYRMPRLGVPKYRGLFRDKPHCVPKHYPEQDPRGKPVGFYGRVYYEDGPPQFKYDGPKKDELYWLERPPYLPSFPTKPNCIGGMKDNMSSRGLNELPTMDTTRSVVSAPASRASPVVTMNTARASAGPGTRAPRATKSSVQMFPDTERFKSTYKTSYIPPSDMTKRNTIDGVGYL